MTAIDVPVVLLAGGLGTRLAEETDIRPKPMVEIGGQPILWHIMKTYAHFGVRRFFVALGYKGESIKRYFRDFQLLSGSIELQLKNSELTRLDPVREAEDWSVSLIETGAQTNTGGRVLRMRPYLPKQTFMLSYGDGVADIDIAALLAFHRAHGKLATITAVRPPARFGALVLNGSQIIRFSEKPVGGEGWINGGYMVLEPGVFEFLKRADETSLEADGLEALAHAGELMAYQHPGFWQCMDTLRDKIYLQDLWNAKQAPWKNWL
jgi:glucose-1-phosphate cytidylyltransferase